MNQIHQRGETGQGEHVRTYNPLFKLFRVIQKFVSIQNSLDQMFRCITAKLSRNGLRAERLLEVM